MTDLLFHAATRQDWDARSADSYLPAGYATEGFIHLSTGGQLPGVLAARFAGRRDLLVLTIDPATFTDPLVWEDLYDGGQDFPHLYGPLSLDSVVSVLPLPCDDAGRFDWWRPDDPVAVHRVDQGTGSVVALLDHLHDDGRRPAVPKPRWIDRGLVAVDVIAGTTVGYPLPKWLRSPEPLEHLGAMVAELHRASVGFEPPGPWLAAPGGVLGPGEVVNHNDLGPGNVVWHGGLPAGIIDWEFAEPGPPEVDLVHLAVSLGGHLPPEKRAAGGFDGLDVGARLDALAAGYGGYTRADLVAAAPDVLTLTIERFESRQAAGHPRWLELADFGIVERLEANRDHAIAAVAGTGG